MAIVTDKLIGYWHYKNGITSGYTNNLSPTNKGLYNLQVFGGITLNSEGFVMDGNDDYFYCQRIPSSSSAYELEFVVKTPSAKGSADDMFMYFSSLDVEQNIGMSIAQTQSLSAFNIVEGFVNHSVNTSSILKLNVSFNTSTKMIGVFVNGTQILNYNASGSSTNIGLSNSLYFGVYAIPMFGFLDYFFKGIIKSIKLYDKVLSASERNQNLATDMDTIGIETGNPTPPQPTIVSNSKTTLSRNADFRQSNLVFKFDKKVTQWTVNVGGTSPTTGYVADSGGVVNANTNITAIVDDMELQSEGQNKVNIYGKGEDGLWTAYES